MIANKTKYLILFLFINFGGLALGSWLMNNGPNTDWYLNLTKLMNRNKIKYLVLLAITFFLRIQFFLIFDLPQHTFDH